MFHSNKIAGSPSSVKVVTYTEQESNQEYKEQISQLERQVEQKKKELEICMEANRSENLIEMKKLKRELISLND